MNTLTLVLVCLYAFTFVEGRAVTKFQFGLNVPHQSALEGDDILVDEEDGKNTYTSYKDFKWPTPRIPFEFNNDVTYEQRQKIFAVAKEWKDKTCLRWEAKTAADKYWVTFRNSTRGRCSSKLGFLPIPNRNKINLAAGCYQTGTLLHEMSHTIGINHEQNRRDRDQYVEVLLDNVVEKMKHNFKKAGDEVTSYGTPYDYESLMHYGGYDFGIQDRINEYGYPGPRMTIRTLDPAFQKRIGQRADFTETDIKQINAMYCCGKPTGCDGATGGSGAKGGRGSGGTTGGSGGTTGITAEECKKKAIAYCGLVHPVYEDCLKARKTQCKKLKDMGMDYLYDLAKCDACYHVNAYAEPRVG